MFHYRCDNLACLPCSIRCPENPISFLLSMPLLRERPVTLTGSWRRRHCQPGSHCSQQQLPHWYYRSGTKENLQPFPTDYICRNWGRGRRCQYISDIRLGYDGCGGETLGLGRRTLCTERLTWPKAIVGEWRPNARSCHSYSWACCTVEKMD